MYWVTGNDVAQETKRQLSLWPDLALLGCCLISLHFLCDSLTSHPVVLFGESILQLLFPETRMLIPSTCAERNLGQGK